LTPRQGGINGKIKIFNQKNEKFVFFLGGGGGILFLLLYPATKTISVSTINISVGGELTN
jgi:hypothetical protein